MKFGNDIGSRFGRLLLSGFITLILLAIIDSVSNGSQPAYFLPLLLVVILSDWYENPTGTLTEEGVYVRHFIVKRFYRWSEIRQMGILARNGRKTYYEIILVKPGASVRTGAGDQTFLWRNLFRLIHIPYDPGTLHYITACYGPWDFDERGVW